MSGISEAFLDGYTFILSQVALYFFGVLTAGLWSKLSKKAGNEIDKLGD